MGAWDSVVLINWHWRPKPLRVTVQLKAAWPPLGGPLQQHDEQEEVLANHRPPFEGGYN